MTLPTPPAGTPAQLGTIRAQAYDTEAARGRLSMFNFLQFKGLENSLSLPEKAAEVDKEQLRGALDRCENTANAVIYAEPFTDPFYEDSEEAPENDKPKEKIRVEYVMKEEVARLRNELFP